MDKEKILQAMEHVDEGLLAEAAEPGAVPASGGWSKAALMAACLCLALTGVVLAAVYGDLRIDFFHGSEWLSRAHGSGNRYEMGGYWPTTTVRVPVKAFSKEVRAMAAAEPKDRTKVYGYTTWGEMETAIGLEVADNPLLDRAQRVSTRFYVDDEEFVAGHSILQVFPDLEWVSLSARYLLYDTISISLEGTVVSDRVDRETAFLEYGTASAYAGDMRREEYTMACGRTATIVSSSVLLKDGSLGAVQHTAVFQGDSAIICVRASDLADEFEVLEAAGGKEALTVLREVLDAFT